MKKFTFYILATFAFVLVSATSFALPPDVIDTHGGKVFSIGDIHGDKKALVKILEALGLYSSKTGSWTGGNSHLVFTGDLVDRGPETKEVMDLIMSLETKAAAAGGGVHTLIGNHEVLMTMGVLRYAHQNDFDNLGDGTEESLVKAYQGDTPYAKWIRNRNAIIRVNNTVFVHGGLGDWAKAFTISKINKMLNDWILYFQKKGPRPASDTSWVYGDVGPLWTRRFGDFMDDERRFSLRPAVENSWLDPILAALGAKRVAVGHTIVMGMDVSLNHPIFGPKVVMTDTGISIAYKGLLTAYEYRDDQVIGYQIDRNNGTLVRTASSPKLPTVISCQKIYR